jgi:hypothetical protein
MSKTVEMRQLTYLYSYPVPEKENVQVTRLPPDARGGDTYQVVVDVEATPEECFDILTDFDLQQKSSGVITEVKVLKRDADGASIAMKVKPEVDTGVFHYRYAFDRKNTQFFYWVEKYEGPDPVFYAISVETRIYTFGRFSRVILTENFLMAKDKPMADSMALFTGIGHDMLNRVKKNKKK